MRSRKGIRRFVRITTPVFAAAFALVLVPSTASAAPKCRGQIATIVGTPGDNTLTGTNGRDVIVGGGGNDTINAKGGRDLACGGGGSDIIDGGGRADRVYGGPGFFDVVAGGSGDDLIHGGGGMFDVADLRNALGNVRANLQTGNATGHGTDRLVGIESVYSGRGDDLLLGTNGLNDFYGGDGDDEIRSGNGHDFIIPGLGDDMVVAGGAFDFVDFFCAAEPPDGTIMGCTPAYASPIQVNLTAGTATGQGTDTLNSVEGIGAGDGNDTIIGTSGDNELLGFGGNDTITGDGGNDFIGPGLGDDTVDGGANAPVGFTSPEDAGDVAAYDFVSPIADPPSAVTVDLDAGTATGAGTDSLTGIESASGTQLNDTLTGDAGRNRLQGLDGSDNLDGLAGDDLLDGDAVIFGQNFPGTDDLDGGPGTADICLGGETTTNCESTTSPFPPPPGIGYLLRAGVVYGIV